MINNPLSRRNFLGLTAGAAGAAALAACGSSGPSNSPSTGGGAEAASYWSLSGQPGEPIRQAAIDRFNTANRNATIAPTFFQNDVYKQQLNTSLDADKVPTRIRASGGSGLCSY